MTVTLDLTEETINIQLRTALLAMIPAPAVEVILGQINRVATPKGPNFIVFWPTRRAAIATTVRDWSGLVTPPPTVITSQQSTQVDVQLDIHGPRGADISQVLATLWGSPAGVQALADAGGALSPLFSDDRQQMPFINENQQYENRWILKLAAQANPIVSTTQQFANTVAAGLIEIDATYPPEPVAP